MMDQKIVQARIVRVEGMCDQWGIDLTAGCSHDCGYCHFHKYQVRQLQMENRPQTVAQSLAVDDVLQRTQYPPTLYFSPFTDPFASAAIDGLEQVLRRVLPLSVEVVLSTKAVVPRRIFRILADFPEQVVLFIGVTSLDDERNRSVEPGCAPAAARLANFTLAREYGLFKLLGRLDPLLPGVDDAAGDLRALVDEIAIRGAMQASAAYLFLTPLANRAKLARNRYLQEAIGHCTETCPIENGIGLSVPLARKLETYHWLHTACEERGLHFGTCGCKDLRITGASFGTSCSYPLIKECSAATRKKSTMFSLPIV